MFGKIKGFPGQGGVKQQAGEEDKRTKNNIRLSFDKMGKKNPAEDFEKLLNAHVFPTRKYTT